MNRFAKFSFFTGIACAVIVFVFLLRHQDILKSKDSLQPQHREEPAIDPSLEPQPVNPPALSINELGPGIPQSAVDTEGSARDKVSKAILGKIAGQSDLDGYSEEELLGIFLDSQAALKDRCKAAWHLAKNSNSEILRDLERILLQDDTPAQLKAAIAEGLGYSSDPEAKNIIISALKDKDEIVVRGAIRGLSAKGDTEAVSILSDIVRSGKARKNVITEAAIGLGNIAHPDAYNALMEIYNIAKASGDVELKEDIISALGYRDIAETGRFFEKLMEENASDSSLRIAVIEALQDAKGETGSFFLRSLSDQNSEVRAEAAWALASAEEPGEIGDDLLKLLEKEGDAEVRKRLYQALGNQEEVNIDKIAGYIFDESDLDTRLAGYDLLAKQINNTENAALREQFDHSVINDLREVALSADGLNLRLSAVITLKRVNTQDAVNALEEIAAKSLDAKVVKATGINR